MFEPIISMQGRINGNIITIIEGNRYKINCNKGSIRDFEGTLGRFDIVNNQLFIGTVKGGYWIPFSWISNIQEI